MSSSKPRCRRTLSTASLMMDKVFSPRKSILIKSRIFDDGTFVLGYEHLLARLLIICRADGYPIRNIVTANNSTAGMHTRTTYVTFQHLGVFHRIAHQRDRAMLPQPASSGTYAMAFGRIEFLDRESYPARACTDGPIRSKAVSVRAPRP